MAPSSSSSSYLLREPDGTSTNTTTSLIGTRLTERRYPLDEQVKERVPVEPHPDLRVRCVVGAAPEVDHRAPPAELGLELDLDVAMLRLDETRADDVGDRDRIVDRRAVPAVRLAV